MPPESTAVVDLRSDTVTRPSPEMLSAMMTARVGDHVLGDDPTAAELEITAAEMLGKESALFFPSGIMANQTAILALSERGTEVVLDGDAHILQYEEGAASAWAGVQLRGIPSVDGVPDPSAYRAELAGRSRFRPKVSLVCLENTHNAHGGRVLPFGDVIDIVEAAHAAGVAIHLDGARLPNAAVASATPMHTLAEPFDTVMVSLSKGLGAPVGSVLAGNAAIIERAWRIRRRLGGGMRQAGILAAAGIHALRNNLQRLEEDHRRPRRLADALATIDGLRPAAPETNIVMVDLARRLGPAAEAVESLRRLGVLASDFGSQRVRLVTHLDVGDDGVDRAVAAFRELAAARS